MKELYHTDTAIINLRPLPQSTERHWEYTNINEKEHYNLYNFSKRKTSSDTWSELRLKVIKEAFELCKNSLILGSGDKNTKRAFFQKIWPDIEFRTEYIDKLELYISTYPKIVLSNYYDHRSGIKLSGLKEIFKYTIIHKMI